MTWIVKSIHFSSKFELLHFFLRVGTRIGIPPIIIWAYVAIDGEVVVEFQIKQSRNAANSVWMHKMRRKEIILDTKWEEWRLKSPSTTLIHVPRFIRLNPCQTNARGITWCLIWPTQVVPPHFVVLLSRGRESGDNSAQVPIPESNGVPVS